MPRMHAAAISCILTLSLSFLPLGHVASPRVEALSGIPALKVPRSPGSGDLTMNCVRRRALGLKGESPRLVLRGGYDPDGEQLARNRAELADVLRDPQIDHAGFAEGDPEDPQMSSQQMQAMQAQVRYSLLTRLHLDFIKRAFTFLQDLTVRVHSQRRRGEATRPPRSNPAQRRPRSQYVASSRPPQHASCFFFTMTSPSN